MKIFCFLFSSFLFSYSHRFCRARFRSFSQCFPSRVRRLPRENRKLNAAYASHSSCFLCFAVAFPLSRKRVKAVIWLARAAVLIPTDESPKIRRRNESTHDNWAKSPVNDSTINPIAAEGPISRRISAHFHFLSLSRLPRRRQIVCEHQHKYPAGKQIVAWRGWILCNRIISGMFISLPRSGWCKFLLLLDWGVPLGSCVDVESEFSAGINMYALLPSTCM